MHSKLDVRNAAIRVLQPQLVDDPVYQGEDKTDQQYVGMRDELPMVLRCRHVDPQNDPRRGVTQPPYQKPSIEIHWYLQSPVLEQKCSTSLLRSPVRNVLEAHQSLRVRYHAMLHIEIPGRGKVRNEFCGCSGTTFLNRRI